MQPEQARLGIARLRARGDRADLGKAETQVQQRVGNAGVLVEARRHAERIGKIQPEHILRQQGIVVRRRAAAARAPARKPSYYARARRRWRGAGARRMESKKPIMAEVRQNHARRRAQRQRQARNAPARSARAHRDAGNSAPRARARRPAFRQGPATSTRDQQQIVLTGEMFGRRLLRPARGGKMDEAVGADRQRRRRRRPVSTARRPGLRRHDFVDQRQMPSPRWNSIAFSSEVGSRFA